MKAEAQAAIRLQVALAEMRRLADEAMDALGPALDHLETAETPQAIVDVIASLQGILSATRDVESGALRRAGQMVRDLGWESREGTMADGRPWVLRRTADRKAWDHDSWKRDVRSAVIGKVQPWVVIDPATGEERDLAPVLYDLAEAIQAVHGAAAPKSTTLKALGLDPGDYCETVRGNWKLDVLPETTTTEETPA